MEAVVPQLIESRRKVTDSYLLSHEKMSDVIGSSLYSRRGHRVHRVSTVSVKSEYRLGACVVHDFFRLCERYLSADNKE